METPVLDRQILMSLVHYDPETGLLTWKTARKKCRVGDAVGNLDSKGYLRCMLLGVEYRVHRLIWFYMTGEWPPVEIDHKNRVRTDNRWNNLRLATAGEQRQNQGIRSDSETGFRGVGYLPAKNKWLARIAINNTRKSLGWHDTIIDAVAARLRAERALYTHSPIH